MQFLWWVVSEVKGSAQRSGDVFFVVSVASKPCLRAEAPIFLERMEVEGLPGHVQHQERDKRIKAMTEEEMSEWNWRRGFLEPSRHEFLYRLGFWALGRS